MRQPFIHDDFLLTTAAAKKLYHRLVSRLPIIDFHNHLSPQMLAENQSFANLTSAWLAGDHYKWRAMRTLGVAEKYITGDATDREKFMAWARTLPQLLKNPLYHWAALELKLIFGIDELLNEKTADKIWRHTQKKLTGKGYGAADILQKMNVQVACTTDDPLDDLHFHYLHNRQDTALKIYPTFRPDKARNLGDGAAYNVYLKKLSAVSKIKITTFDDLCVALAQRHDFFAQAGCRLSDHSLEDFTEQDSDKKIAAKIFAKVRMGKPITREEQARFTVVLLDFLATLDYEKNWVRQLHIGALRNPNRAAYQKYGADTGFDALADFTYARALAQLLSNSAMSGKLPRTILYNLNPRDNAMLAVMCGSFQDGTAGGRLQLGAAWWFLDQADGIKNHLETLGQLGALSQFVGMLTDSRSVLSMPRHHYFRRILCATLGSDMENGLIPSSFTLVGKMVENISYYNAKNYLGF